MMFFRFLFLALPLMFSGCINLLPKVKDLPQLYTLTPKNTYPAGLQKVDWQLAVDEPFAPASINTQQIAVMVTPYRVDYYSGVRWTDSVPRMVQTLMIDSFENSGHIKSVSRDSMKVRPDYLLTTEIRSFYATPQKDGRVKVNANLGAKLIEMPSRHIVGAKFFKEEAFAQRDDIHLIMEAYDSALGSILKNLVVWTLQKPEHIHSKEKN